MISVNFKNLLTKDEVLPEVIGRDKTIRQLVQIMYRPTNHHVAIIGEPGIGKSTLVSMLATAVREGALPHLPSRMYELETSPIINLFISGENPRNFYQAMDEAISKLDGAIIVIEDIQLLSVDDPSRLELTRELFQTITKNPNVYLIVSTTETAYARTFRDDYIFGRIFSPLEIDQLSDPKIKQIVANFANSQGITIDKSAIEATVELGGKYGRGRGLPDASLRLFEEALVKMAFEDKQKITRVDIEEIISERERIPVTGLNAKSGIDLANLERGLNSRVIGQLPVMKVISRTIMNAELGLGDATRPRGSFLLLGPSGVGKTETAKTLSELVYRDTKAMVRLDMSEYSEAHTAVRLTGAPPGYVGYEEGGQLTGAIDRQPNSLVLLDEIEKAHPKLFDMFLQLLDDGRLTDSKGKTVDFTHTMVLATSNIGSQEISDASLSGVDISSPEFLRDKLMPLLLRQFRPEFINRFDAVLVYQPLSVLQLIDLAKRELAKLEDRLSSKGIRFQVADKTLQALLQKDYNPLFGARPVKRLVAQHFELPIAEMIVTGRITEPIIIDGLEPWLQR